MERKLDSQIFQVIDEMEDYISNCKSVFMSTDKIVVHRETIENFIHNLKRKAPDEIEKYRKIIRNQEAILEDAKNRAQHLIDKTVAQTDEMVSENEVMRRAYAQADEVVRMANDQAQQIVDSAAVEANELRAAASQYMEEVMIYLENVLTASTKAANDQYGSLINTLSSYTDKIREDRKQLHPDDATAEVLTEQPQETQE